MVRFRDRTEAGRKLAEAFGQACGSDPLVLAPPRGGVPVAFEVAKVLQAPLDVPLVRKIGAPGHSEYGIGAATAGVGQFETDPAITHCRSRRFKSGIATWPFLKRTTSASRNSRIVLFRCIAVMPR